MYLKNDFNVRRKRLQSKKSGLCSYTKIFDHRMLVDGVDT